MIPQKILYNAKFLIIRLSAIGDLLHATTVVHNLRLRYPECHITWLASPPASELLKYNPDIDRLLTWDRRPCDKAFSHGNIIGAYLRVNEAEMILKKHKYDIAIDIQGLFLTGLIAKKSGARYRIGIHERHEFNSLFMTDMAPETRHVHKIRRYMTALEPLGIRGMQEIGLILNLPPRFADFADDFWQKANILPKLPILMVCVRTSWPAKNWRPENFGLALNGIPEDIQIVFCGTEDDEDAIRRARRKMDRSSVSIAGKVSLLELAALFKTATLLLTCDTGPLYIAEAVHLKTLSLWGPTHPDMYGPLTEGHRFIISQYGCTNCCKTKCRHKSNGCMNDIDPGIVERRLLDLLHIRTGDSKRDVIVPRL